MPGTHVRLSATARDHGSRLINYKPSASDLLNAETKLALNFDLGFGAVEPQYHKVATVIQMDEPRMSFADISLPGTLERWNQATGRRAKQLRVLETAINAQKFTETLKVSFDDIKRGKLSAAAAAAKRLGQSAKMHPDRLIFGEVLKDNGICMFDEKALFADDHLIDPDDASKGTFSNQITSGTGPFWYLVSNAGPAMVFGPYEDYSFGMDGTQGWQFEIVEYGSRFVGCAVGGCPHFVARSNKPLTTANLEELMTLMTTYVSPEGVPVSNTPSQLVIPPALNGAAQRVVGVAVKDKGGSNEYYGALEIVSTPWLNAVPARGTTPAPAPETNG